MAMFDKIKVIWIGNYIGNEGGGAISEALKFNASLTTLFLSSCEMNTDFQLLLMIMNCPPGNKIEKEGARMISEDLASYKGISSLHLEC